MNPYRHPLALLLCLRPLILARSFHLTSNGRVGQGFLSRAHHAHILLGMTMAPTTRWGRSVPQARLFSHEDDGGLESTDKEDAWEDMSIAGDSEYDDEVEEVEPQQDEGGDEALSVEFEQWTKASNDALEGLRKKLASLEREFEKAQNLEETLARAQLIVNNLYLFTDPSLKTIDAFDWEKNEEVTLTLDPSYESASAEADALFEKARKSKRGSLIVQGLLDATQAALQIIEDSSEDLKSALTQDGSIDEGRLRLVQDRLTRTASATKFQIPKPESAKAKSSTSSFIRQKKPQLGSPASNIRKFLSPNGCIVLVGRNRRGNEHLSLSVARGNDIWMHSRGCPGAHVLIYDRRGSPQPQPECIQFGANLAAFYSDGRTERKVPITLAEPKHLLKPRGAPLGAIKLREEIRVVVGFPDDVPEELKEARAESLFGGERTEEYRSADKAKRRRRTQENSKRQQLKRKQQKKNVQKESE